MTKIKTFLLALGFLLLFNFSLLATTHAAPCTPNASNKSTCICSSQGCDDGTIATTEPASSCDNTKNTLSQTQQQSCDCFGAPNYTLTAQEAASCKDCNRSSPTGAQLNNCLRNNRIIKRINQIVYVLSGMVALVITGSIIYGGFQYIIGGDVAENVHAGKARIIRAMVALIAFLFTFGFLQWVIPGGI